MAYECQTFRHWPSHPCLLRLTLSRTTDGRRTMPQRILVTGATGTVGRQVMAQLVEIGVEIRALTREPVDLPPTVEGVRGDLSVPDSLHAAFDGVEAVFLVWPFASA